MTGAERDTVTGAERDTVTVTVTGAERDTVTVTGAERDTLTEERDQLLRSIDDLARELAAGDIDDRDYRTLVDSYTARAAEVLRQLSGEPSRKTNRAVAPTTGRKPRWRSLITVAVIGLAAVGTGIFVARSAGERVGQTGLTGSVRSASSLRDDQLATLLDTARSNLADDPLTALTAYDEVRQLDPENVEAIAYGGWLVRNVARSATDEAQRKELLDAAIRRLDEAIRIDPTYPDALAFRAIIFLRDQEDPKSAAAVFDALDKLNPPEGIRQLVGSAEEEARAAANP